MVYILQLIFLSILFYFFRKGNRCYKILVGIQVVSLCAAPLVSNTVKFDTWLTFFNTLFCLANLLLIILPWRKASFLFIDIEDANYFRRYKKILYFILGFTIINNLIVTAIVRIYIPDIAVFKAQLGFKELYGSIPYFGLLFRYTAVSADLGLLALPICAYYLKEQKYKKSLMAFCMSLASFLASVALNSRAKMLSYVILCICLFYYVEGALDGKIKRIANKIVKYVVIVGGVVFAAITVLRFSSSTMYYYGDRIPETSYIKDPVLYSVFDYTSMGFTKGIEQLELHEVKDVMKGEPLVYDIKQLLSYFHIISWDAEEYAKRLADAYNKPGLVMNSSGAFHGYTCRMVKIMGYVCTMLFDLLYYRYVRRKSRDVVISVKSLSILIFLLIASINSIFYCTYPEAILPLVFYIVVSIPSHLQSGKIVIREQRKLKL